MRVIVATHFLPFHVTAATETCNHPDSCHYDNNNNSSNFHGNSSPQQQNCQKQNPETLMDELELAKHSSPSNPINIPSSSSLSSSSSKTCPMEPLISPDSDDNNRSYSSYLPGNTFLSPSTSPENYITTAKSITANIAVNTTNTTTTANTHVNSNNLTPGVGMGSASFVSHLNQMMMQNRRNLQAHHLDENHSKFISSSNDYYTPHYKNRISSISSNASWNIEPFAGGNVGLHNAINASAGKAYDKKVWVGLLAQTKEHISPVTWPSVQKTLIDDYDCQPLVATDLEMHLYYTIFCKQTLWPLLHYTLPDYVRGRNEGGDKSWQMYIAMNEKFAQKIIDVYEPGDVVWIQDYHLMLLPLMLRQKLPLAKIGFFLHVPFPSSEIMRCLFVRRQVLEGMLGANLIGFQTYQYARHFLQTCSRILGFECSPKGIQVNDGFVVAVGIFPMGINAEALVERQKQPEVQRMIASMRQKYAGRKVVVGRDKLDFTKGVKQKLYAFEKFLSNHPEWIGKVVLIQVALSTTEQQDLSTIVIDLVSRINSRFGTISYRPVVFLKQNISFHHYLALLSVADACLITSLRDGMNLTSHEYIVCQADGHSPLIISEFAGTYSSLHAAIRINPWDTGEVAEAIHEALLMGPEEKTGKHLEMYNYVVNNNAVYWASSFVKELERSALAWEQMLKQHSNLDFDLMKDSLKKSRSRLFIFDYETIFKVVNNEPKPLKYYTSRGLGRKSSNPSSSNNSSILLDSLMRLIKTIESSDKRIYPVVDDEEEIFMDDMTMIGLEDGNDDVQVFAENVVFILGSQKKSVLSSRFKDQQGIGLVAEGGCFIRYPTNNRGEWTDLLPDTDLSWRHKVLEILEYYTERTPGSEIENKDICLAWNWRQADPIFGSWMAKECQTHIQDSIGSRYPIHVTATTSRTLEISPRNASKRNTLLHLLKSRYPKTDFVFYLGPDRIDENNDIPQNFFATALFGRDNNTDNINHNKNIFCSTIRDNIGGGGGGIRSVSLVSSTLLELFAKLCETIKRE